jgi:CheY-like chemotaxis protein
MSLRVLVADDEPDIRRLLGLRLEMEGWSADVAASGEEALDMWRSRTYDVAVLDQRMGSGMTGIATAHALREKGFTKPIVIFSAYLEPEIEEAAVEVGVRTIAKSEVGDLCAIVASVVEDAVRAQSDPPG